MTRSSVCVVLLFAAAFVTGCPDKPAPADVDAGAALGPVDAGPPELTVRISGQVPDGGAVIELPIEPDGRPEIPQVQSLELHTNIPLQNYRVRVFDDVDKAMVSDDVAHDEPQGTRYQIAFPAPLRTGHKYTLVVDAQTGVQFTDAFGRSHPDLRIPFRIAGEKQPDPPPEKPKKKRRR